jgi:putative ABC transport system permease protein
MSDRLMHRVAARLIQALLLLYPPSFRRRFGRAMLDDFRDRLDERSSDGALSVASLTLRTAADVIATAVRERVRPSSPRDHAWITSPDVFPAKGSPMDHLRLDVRFALRSLARRPGFTVAAVLTLALGIGANTAIFSVVNGVLLRALPYPEPERVLMVWAQRNQLQAIVNGAQPQGRSFMSQPDIESVRELPGLLAVEGYSTRTLTLTGTGSPEQIDAGRVTGGLLEVFGLSPVLGRDIRHEENSESAPTVVVIGYGYWQERLGGRPDVLGTTIELSEQSYEIIGVAPPGFDFPGGAQLWIPYRLNLMGCGRGCHVFQAGLARLAPGITLESAQANLTRLAVNLSRDFPDTNTDKGFGFERIGDWVVHDVRDGLWMLLGAVAVVLLIACANVANLLLVRAAARRGEVAVRAALGASRGRLVSQVLIESLVLAFAGAAIGVVLASAGVGALKQVSPGTIPRIDSVSIDVSVLLFSLGVTVLVALLFGLSPALRLAATPVVEGLRAGARGGQLPRENWSRAVLLSVEVGLSLVLLVGAGLLMRSLARLYDVDMGFDGREVVRFRINLPPARYDSLETIVTFYQTLEERIAALPGVASVGSVFGAPLASGDLWGDVRFEGQPEAEPGKEIYTSVRSATPGYMRAMGLELLRGRGIEPTDRAGTLPVAVVNDVFLR